MKKFIFLAISLLFLFVNTHFVFAQSCTDNKPCNSGLCSDGKTPCTADAGTVVLANPLSAAGINDPQQLIGNIISAILGLVGSVALIIFVYGGFVWMTSAGNEQRIKEGRGTLMWAALGLIVIFASYALVKFVIFGVIGAK